MSVRLLTVLVGTIAAGALMFAGTAAADPGQPGCAPLSPLCNVLPALPELDHDIDLTVGQHETLNQEHLLPPDPCAAGCA